MSMRMHAFGEPEAKENIEGIQCSIHRAGMPNVYQGTERRVLILTHRRAIDPV